MFATRALRMRPTQVLRLKPTMRMMREPAEDQAGHTVSQRLRKLRKIPAELIPLGVVVGFAIVAAGYSSFRKFTVDKNLRLTRLNRQPEAPHGKHGEDEEHH